MTASRPPTYLPKSATPPICRRSSAAIKRARVCISHRCCEPSCEPQRWKPRSSMCEHIIITCVVPHSRCTLTSETVVYIRHYPLSLLPPRAPAQRPCGSPDPCYSDSINQIAMIEGCGTSGSLRSLIWCIVIKPNKSIVT